MADEKKELLPQQPTAAGAGAGGWTPSKGTPVWAACVIGTIFASAPAIVLAIPDAKIGAAVSAVLMGIAGSLSTYFGMRSAGPRSR